MPETQPTPLGAILAAAEDANRAHDRLCDLAETLVPESSPVKTANNPAPVVLPTVDEVAATIALDDGETIDPAYIRNARAVLDLIASRVTVWVPVEPGTVIKAGTRYRVEWDPEADDEPTTAAERVAYNDCIVDPIDPGRYSIDPRTVPAVPTEPEDPGVAVVVQWWRGSIEPVATDKDAARDLLARIDAARADQ